MYNLEKIQELKEYLSVLSDKSTELGNELKELCNVIDAEQFIPDTISESIKTKLDEIGIFQKEFLGIYQSIHLGDIPETIPATYQKLNDMERSVEEKSVYADAVYFFTHLHSENPEIEKSLEICKAKLAEVDVYGLSVEECRRFAEKYVILKNAYNESNSRKKLALIFQVKESFPDDVLMEINFGGMLYVRDQEAEVVENIEETSANLADDGEVEIGEAEDSSAEPMLKTSDQEDVFHACERDIYVKEDKTSLKVDCSVKENNRFGVKEFRNDILKQNGAIRKLCMIDAFENQGTMPSALAAMINKPVAGIELVCEQLKQCGYLRKYTVKGYGSFYSVSRRGEKAFTTRESAALLGRRMTVDSREKVIPDTVNSAMIRLLCFKTPLFVKKINPDYELKKMSQILGTDYFCRQFPEISDGKNYMFTGIISENEEEFLKYKNALQEAERNFQCLVVLGLNRNHAQIVGEWIQTELPEVYEDRIVFYLGADEAEEGIASEFLTEPEEKEVLESKEVSEENGTGQLELKVAEEVKTETALEEEAKVAEKVQIASDSEVEPKVTEEISAGKMPEKEIVEEPELEVVHAENIPVQKEAQKDHMDICQKMLCTGKIYCGTAYMKAVSNKYSGYAGLYRQLAYALNDPLENCSYHSDQIFGVYFNTEQISEYFAISAVIRNYFYDQCSFDYSLQQLQAAVNVFSLLTNSSALSGIVYRLQRFKAKYHRGIDRYAEYRKKDKVLLEKHLKENRREAKEFFDNYVGGLQKENASHRRFIETRRLIFSREDEFGIYLQAVMNDDDSKLESMESFLTKHCIKSDSEIQVQNIDSAKIEQIIDVYWDLAGENMLLAKKTSDLMGSLRMNLFKLVKKVISVLCNYVFYKKSSEQDENDPGLQEYERIHLALIKDMDVAIAEMEHIDNANDLAADSGKKVLSLTLKEMRARLDGSYREETEKYFYIEFLKNDKVLLDDEYLPVLDEIPELPEMSAMNRIEQHYREEDSELVERLDQILKGGDDYGSAELIIRYLKSQSTELEQDYDLEKAVLYPQKDMENRKNEFIGDLELAQSYGQIDNTEEDRKEAIVAIMLSWYSWALETKNYGFFRKILSAFSFKIKKDSQVREKELDNNLQVYLEKNTDWEKDALICHAVNRIRNQIQMQNYAAAEDLLNRVIADDLEGEGFLNQTDYLEEFLRDYDSIYRKTSNPGTTLRTLVYNARINKDTKGANRLLESWMRGNGVGESKIKELLIALGFNVDTVRCQLDISGKIENYLVKLKKPQNGRRSNYKHPIAAFGSQAEQEGFRVVCLFGKTDAGRLIDTFREIGNAKNTLVLLDFALTLAERRGLARKTKAEAGGKIFAVIDRVVMVYLANHYAETSVNRMLMSIIMPFAYYQPYIADSATVMPQEIFIGRKFELEKIESPTGVNIVYGGRQLGKSALLRMAQKDIDRNENGDRAIIVDIGGLDYKKAAKKVAQALYDEGVLREECSTDEWDELARNVKNRLREEGRNRIPYLLLMLDEADAFIESCETVVFQPFSALKDIQGIGQGRFKFVVAGLRNIVRFKKDIALGRNSVFAHLESLTVTPFKAAEARELLETPLSYLGFRFPRNEETDTLVSTIFGTTNYFPGLIQLYCSKLIEAMRRDYAGYTESETPPYYMQKEHIKKVLAEQELQKQIREKFFITLKVGNDDYYYIIALLVASHYHDNRNHNGCSARNILELADGLEIRKIQLLDVEKINALMEELRELNILQRAGEGRYRFARYSFYQMMGNVQQIDDELEKYMGE